MTNKNLIIKLEEAGKRLDIFLSEKLKITRSQAQKMIAGGLVLLNDSSPQKTGSKIKNGDKISIKPLNSKVPIKKDKKKTHEKVFTIKDIKIMAETDEYFIVEKPVGMLTHSTMKNEPDSLAELLSKKYPALKEVGDDPKRPGIVHRLDKDASGLLVIAKTQKMFDHLKQQFKARTIDKEYSVLVHGKTPKDHDIINFRIERSQTAPKMAAIPYLEKGLLSEIGKEAKTEYDVVKRFINFTLLKIKIHTGRMHQIRVHMLAYNNPVVGDPLYFQKKRKTAWDKKLGRLFLHCTKLSFKDLSGIEQTYESPLPENLKEFLKLLK